MSEPEDLDPEYLADIEARLYSQVFHSVDENQQENGTESTELTDNRMITSNKQKYRYFEPQQNNVAPLLLFSSQNNYIKDYIALSTEPNLPVFQQEVIVSPNAAKGCKQSGLGSIIQNNITVHQYTLPLVYHTNSKSSTNSKSIEIVEQEEADFLEARRQRRREKRLRLRKKKKQAAQRFFKKLRRSDEVICLSDSDDCVVIQNDESSKHNKEPEHCTDSDEDIIYIPAPAPEVINVDADDTNDKSDKNKSPSHFGSNPSNQVQMPESTVSNDFLDNNSVDSAANFNFSLHGADFNAQSNDFVRPVNPVENCETESSCSTNDQSRDISNSVKTIVFDEVEFPREDIFADKSLESFKTFITPQRKSDAQSTPLRRYKTQSTQKKKHITSTASSSSDSSSESDYDEGSNCNQFENLKGKKNLPSLSLIQNKPSLTKGTKETCENKEPLSDDCNKMQPFNESIKVSNKSRKRRLQSSEVDAAVKDGKDKCDSQNSDQDTPGENREQSGKKQDTSKSKVEVETEETPEISTKTQPANESINMSNKSRKKRLQPTVFENVKDGEDVGESQKSESETLLENKVQSKKKQVSPDDVVEAEMAVTSTPKSTKKKKSRKSENEDSFMSQVIVIDETEETEVKTSVKKKKKRKSCSTIPDISVLREMIVIDEIDLVEEDLEKVAGQEATGDDLKLANCVSKTQEDNINQNRFLDNSLVDVTDFDLESIQRTQSDKPDLWKICTEDRLSGFHNTEPKGPRCNRCRHFGHIGIHCTEKPDPPPCYLCGAGDHQEPRCPNKICTQCGTPGRYSTTYCGNCFKFRHIVCRMCQQKGHIEKTCPDLWRRYHLTTERGPIVPATGDQLKPRNQRWCSGCGSQGHLEHECGYYQRIYPPTLPYVVNYDDVLNQDSEGSVGARSDGQDIIFSEPQHPTVAIDPCFTNVLQNVLSLELQNQGAIPQQGAVIPSLLDLPIESPNAFAVALQKSVMPTPGSTALNVLTTASTNTKYSKMKIDVTYIKNYFTTAPGRKIQSFLEKELAELDSCTATAKNMKMLLFRTERFYSIKKKSRYDQQRVAVGFRALNMFIFGHHQLRDGRQHVNYLRSFLHKKKCNLDGPKRKSLLSAYCYIFGPERHNTINYFGILRAIQQRYGNNIV